MTVTAPAIKVTARDVTSNDPVNVAGISHTYYTPNGVVFGFPQQDDSTVTDFPFGYSGQGGAGVNLYSNQSIVDVTSSGPTGTRSTGTGAWGGWYSGRTWYNYWWNSFPLDAAQPVEVTYSIRTRRQSCNGSGACTVTDCIPTSSNNYCAGTCLADTQCYHSACSAGACVRYNAPGPGADTSATTCSFDSQCYHSTCSASANGGAGACVRTNAPGPAADTVSSNCFNNSECQSLRCNASFACVLTGSDTANPTGSCNSNTDCSHSECVNGACQGGFAGATQAGDCTTNANCQYRTCANGTCNTLGWGGRNISGVPASTCTVANQDTTCKHPICVGTACANEPVETPGTACTVAFNNSCAGGLTSCALTSGRCGQKYCTNECGAQITDSCGTTDYQPPAQVSLATPANDAINQPISLNLTWNAPAWGWACNTPVNTYRVYWKKSSDAGYTMNTVPESQTLLTLTGLFYNTVYNWYVVANNGDGDSPASEIRRFTTRPQTWWQAVGGNIFGQGITSLIPSDLIPGFIGLKN